MSTEHAPQAATDPGVHDHATEVKHAWEHFRENAYFFAGFLSLVLCAVLQFEVSPGHNFYWIFALGAARFALIGFFMYSLVRPFSLIVRTFFFTVLFFAGMVFLSMWDSTLKGIGNPIQNKSDTQLPK
jgi:uncharacterized membrane protein YedE/YeeE